jgi:hypothetical protein
LSIACHIRQLCLEGSDAGPSRGNRPFLSKSGRLIFLLKTMGCEFSIWRERILLMQNLALVFDRA